MSVYSLGSIPPIGVKINMEPRIPMSYINQFAQLTTQAAENAAKLVLDQLTARLYFYKHPSKIDEDMECLQFGICSYHPKTNRVIL